MSHIPALGVSNLLCHLCADGPVCAGERRGGCSDETPRGKQQGEEIHRFGGEERLGVGLKTAFVLAGG